MDNANQIYEYLKGLPVRPNSPIVINLRTDLTNGCGIGVEAGYIGDNNLACAFYPRSIPVRDGWSWRDFSHMGKTKEEIRLIEMFVINIHKKDRMIWDIDPYRSVIFYLHPVVSSDHHDMSKLLPQPLYKLFNDHRVELENYQTRLDAVEEGIKHIDFLTKIMVKQGGLNDVNLERLQAMIKVVDNMKSGSDSSSTKSSTEEKKKKS